MDNNLQLLWTIDFIKRLLCDEPEYTGSIKLNFFKGNIGVVQKKESFKPKIKDLTDRIKSDNI